MTVSGLLDRPWLWPIITLPTLYLVACTGIGSVFHTDDWKQVATTFSWCAAYSLPLWIAVLVIALPHEWRSIQPVTLGWIYFEAVSVLIAIGLRWSAPTYAFLQAPAASFEFVLLALLEIIFAAVLSSPLWIPIVGVTYLFSRSQFNLLPIFFLFAVEGFGLALSRSCFAILQIMSF